MYKFVVSIFPILLAWTNADSCLTPLKQRSQCIYSYYCVPLLHAYTLNPLPSQISKFIQQSVCGGDANGQKLCCGPLPFDLTKFNPVEPPNTIDSYLESQKCGVDSIKFRILGGRATELNEFPWLVLLGYRKWPGDINFACDGSLINHRYVLTAAHCLVGNTVKEAGPLTTVRLGEYDILNSADCKGGFCAAPPRDIPVQAYYVHDGFSDLDQSGTDDIGLIRLSRRVMYNDFIKPACLVPYKNAKYPVGSYVTAAGWGNTENGRASSVKLKVTIPIYDQRTCFQKYKQISMYLTQKQICAGGIYNQGVCYGDSGGPLMRLTPDNSWETIGIVSRGAKCGDQGWPAVYIDISSYLDWIKSKMIQTNF